MAATNNCRECSGTLLYGWCAKCQPRKPGEGINDKCLECSNVTFFGWCKTCTP
ncbi:11882_t:CDS:1, partial [Ambispora leptoticha]